jgi:hypothetical protein
VLSPLCGPAVLCRKGCCRSADELTAGAWSGRDRTTTDQVFWQGCNPCAVQRAFSLITIAPTRSCRVALEVPLVSELTCGPVPSYWTPYLAGHGQVSTFFKLVLKQDWHIQVGFPSGKLRNFPLSL